MLRAMMPRPALLSRLDGREGLVSVLAAAGSGKTTLLQQWDAADPRPFLWQAPADAGDPQRTAASVTGAIGPSVLVLDDIHRHPDAGAALVRALAGTTLPAGVAVVVAGRELDRRAHSALRLRPDLIEVGDAELALDEEAAAAVLGPAVDGHAVGRLLRQTGGWAAGLQLARVALARDPGHEFSGSDRLIREYLDTEVVGDLDADLMDVMLGCSPFDEVTGALCDAVLGITDGQARLEALERRHLFVSATDREGRRFRWQPLVREALATELVRRDGERATRLRAEAARVRVKETSAWRAPVLMLCGIAAGLCGDAKAAAAVLDEAIHVSAESDAGPALLLSLAERVEFGRSPEGLLPRALDAAARPPYSLYPQAALAVALHAEASARAGDREQAREALATAHAFRPAIGRELPWLAIQLRLHIARAMASLGDVGGARVVLGEADEILSWLPDPGVLQAQATDLAKALRPLPAHRDGGASLLTTAELRLLPLLPSHFSFEEIGERLHLSRNTIKTQAASVYRKLGVSSRSEAVEHAARLGLVDA